MTTQGAGRPRLTDRKRPGETAREEILDAAAELFTTRGYASTSTRKIADAVGIRQATLYHYFKTKDDILDALLSTTVTPTLEVARRILDSDATPAARLHAVVTFDGVQLWTGRWNIGVLYLLPELRTERFLPFVRARETLRATYRELAAAVLAELAAAGTQHLPDSEEDIPLRLVETLVNLRWDGIGREDEPQRTADAAIRALGWTGDWEAMRSQSSALLAQKE
ncbi:TetR/AcrR family transcriptional regulator [Hoyosella rhizosphaerae]|uniref:TetR family transcriptional regulator n=1 Tax=Hoyosella rhizosphaerae TaxID=1755582 RepID=A0A916U377_9ACTN|nr:TetR/AcrR family transcriptional regulator [Hoyosella rhizosphaerae]MBN4926601.1 TetR/AcrR family transcriptional regulator [Hoyosella rhizosphaerae]GGC57980.1 TetR family transcriptional regulator [Hoyosella rhizosphaerae]